MQQDGWWWADPAPKRSIKRQILWEMAAQVFGQRRPKVVEAEMPSPQLEATRFQTRP
jgi:hypothetical protein